MIGIIFLTMLSAPVGAATYYVSPSGSNSNDGTVAEPFQAIQKGADVAVAGDTVYVKSGVYTEWVDVQNSGTSGNPIVFMAHPGEKPIIDGTGVSVPGWYSLFDVRNKNYIILDGFEVRYSYPPDQTSQASQYLIFFKESEHCIVRNCIIHDNEHFDASGNLLSGGSSSGPNDGKSALMVDHSNNILIGNNEVYHGGRNAIHAQSCNYVTIRNNYVHDNPAHNGLNLFPETGEASQPLYTGNVLINNRVENCKGGIYLRYQKDMLIANNIIFGTKQGNPGIRITVRGSFGSFTDYNYDANIKIYNNTIIGIGNNAIQSDNANYLDIKNNIFRDIKIYEIYLKVSAGSQMDYNLYGDSGQTFYWGGTGYSSLSSFQSAGHDTHSFEADPKFTSEASGDYHLQSTSLAIDNGINLASSGVTTDREGTARPQGNGFDIGAYESPYNPETGLQIINRQDGLNMSVIQ